MTWLRRRRGAEEAPAGAEPRYVEGSRADVAPAREEAAPVRRRRMGRGTRTAGANAVGAVGAGTLALARLIMTVAVLIALLIGVAIVLTDVDANASNAVVKAVHEGANFFAGAFTGLITFSGHHPKREITVDWGIALLVFLVVGAIIARMVAGVGRSGL